MKKFTWEKDGNKEINNAVIVENSENNINLKNINAIKVNNVADVNKDIGESNVQNEVAKFDNDVNKYVVNTSNVQNAVAEVDNDVNNVSAKEICSEMITLPNILNVRFDANKILSQIEYKFVESITTDKDVGTLCEIPDFETLEILINIVFTVKK